MLLTTVHNAHIRVERQGKLKLNRSNPKPQLLEVEASCWAGVKVYIAKGFKAASHFKNMQKYIHEPSETDT